MFLEDNSYKSYYNIEEVIENENFVTLGTDENAPPYEGEIVYKDNEGAICRCWNWREAVRTMLTENALKELAKTVQNDLGGTTQISILDTNNKKISID